MIYRCPNCTRVTAPALLAKDSRQWRCGHCGSLLAWNARRAVFLGAAVMIAGMVGCLVYWWMMPLQLIKIPLVIFLLALIGVMPALRRWTAIRVVERVGTYCASCGYDLRGSAGSVCSECGAGSGD